MLASSTVTAWAALANRTAYPIDFWCMFLAVALTTVRVVKWSTRSREEQPR